MISSPKVDFLTIIIRNTSDIFVICRSELLKILLASILDNSKKLKSISIKPLVSEMALLTTFIYDITLSTVYTHARCPIMQTNHTERVMLLKERRPQTSIAAFSRRDDEMSTDADSSSDSDEYLSDNSDHGAKGAIKHGPKLLLSSKRLLWLTEENESLRRWKADEKDWDWIFSQFPNRISGAVRTRWHTKL